MLMCAAELVCRSRIAMASDWSVQVAEKVNRGFDRRRSIAMLTARPVNGGWDTQHVNNLTCIELHFRHPVIIIQGCLHELLVSSIAAQVLCLISMQRLIFYKGLSIRVQNIRL